MRLQVSCMHLIAWFQFWISSYAVQCNKYVLEPVGGSTLLAHPCNAAPWSKVGKWNDATCTRKPLAHLKSICYSFGIGFSEE